VSQDWFVSVAISESQAAAEAAAARLKAAGIDAHLRQADSAGQPGASGDVVVMVPSGQQAAAHELLRQAPSGDVNNEAGLAFSESISTGDVSAESVTAGLAQIRRRRFMMWFWFFSYLPAAVLVTIRGPAASAPFVAVLWLTAYLVAGALAAYSRCPRCQRRFCSDGRRWNFYTQRCLNCQLPLRGPATAG
jgi:SPOR domain